MGYQETIKRCESMMQSAEDLQGSSQQIRYPLLSVFAGAEAVQYADTVKNVYRKCWMPETVDVIPFVVRENLGNSDIKDAVRPALTHGPYREYNVFYQVFYWDIMDSSFENNFNVLQVKPYVPVTYEVRRIFFLFARMSSEQEAEIAKERGERLIAWAKENNEHIFILTDSTKDGFLGLEQISENYRMAADITVISDSVSNDNKSLQLGFDLMKKNVYSAGYYSQGKNTRQIVAASIVSMLDFYRSAMQYNTGEITGYFENYLGSYSSIFDGIFEKLYQPVLPKDTSFFRFLDFTPQMEAFYRSFSSAGQRRFGFFGRTNEERGMDLSAAVMAKKSIWPFWQAILDKYYVTSVRDVLQSNEDGETGEDRLRYELRSAITSKFSYHQLMSESVREESLRLRKFTIQDVDKVLPRVKPVSTPEEYFAQEAIRDIKVNIYLKFYRVLSEELEKLYLNAGSFMEKIEMIRNYYKEIVKDESINEAYKNIVSRACALKPEYVKGMISPCGKVEELLEQIEKVFFTFTKNIKEYHYSFADELKWRMNVPGGGAVDEVISAAFEKDVSSTARLSAYQSVSGKMYSLMKKSNVPTDNINAELLGEVFDMPQSDQLERLLIYSLDSSTIIWI